MVWHAQWGVSMLIPPWEAMVCYLCTVLKISPSVQNLLPVSCWSPWVFLYSLMYCVRNIPFFFFYWDTGRVHGEVPLWFPYWLLLERGHEAGEVLGLSWDGCFVLTKEEFAVALHALSVNAQTTFLVVKVSDLPFLEECVWHEIPVSWVTMSTLRADTFKFTYKLLSPFSSKLFPSFMRRGKCCFHKVTEKPDYLWCF